MTLDPYEILGDPEKRRRFDTGEIDADGQDRPRPDPRWSHAGASAAGTDQDDASLGAFEDVPEIFADLLGARSTRRHRSASLFGSKGNSPSLARRPRQEGSPEDQRMAPIIASMNAIVSTGSCPVGADRAQFRTTTMFRAGLR